MFFVLCLDVTIIKARKKLCFVLVNQFPIQKPSRNLNKWINIANTTKNRLSYTESHFDLGLQGL